MDNLEQSDVKFIVSGQSYKASLDIAALEAIQEKYGKNAFDYMDEILPLLDFPKIRELMAVIMEANGVEKTDLPDFTKASFNGLMGLVGQLTQATLGRQEMDAPEKKPKAAQAKKKSS
ncbi:MAG: hypothetical protein COB24_08835 [Hyphomicrobiales bacterium]|nr:MAG: hypothetical protein COB24_08835 [Hyphomicrobiales bacterium]